MRWALQKDYLNYTFDQVDTNNDLIISRSEWRASSESFNSLDGNRDGVITRTEFENRSSAGYDYRAYRFDQVDTNNDVIISRSEWRGSLDSFNSLDDNRDNVLTKMEFENRTVATVTVSYPCKNTMSAAPLIASVNWITMETVTWLSAIGMEAADHSVTSTGIETVK
jgi:hypothetical protein